jgi:hypothetical protein
MCVIWIIDIFAHWKWSMYVMIGRGEEIESLVGARSACMLYVVGEQIPRASNFANTNICIIMKHETVSCFAS